jgi:hypothetical protein
VHLPLRVDERAQVALGVSRLLEQTRDGVRAIDSAVQPQEVESDGLERGDGSREILARRIALLAQAGDGVACAVIG